MSAVADAPDLSVVVLAFNEVDNLRQALSELLAELARLGVRWELIIVDDGSSDGTGPLADGLAQQRAGVRVVHHPKNLGLGGGYRTGFREARGEWLTFFPADAQFPAEIIGQFWAHTQRADMVLGYLPKRDRDLVGKTLSWVERGLYKALFRTFPRFQGIMLFRRKLLAELPLVSEGRGWAVVMELILRASRGPYRLVSVPTEVRPRLSGQSKVNNVRSIVANLKQLWTLSQRL
ncbi:MAG TPA: glycosyltransferase family 2 protein [Polyangiales bacterium]